MHAPVSYLLGLDIGTTNVKALLVTLDGQIVRVAACPTPTRLQADGHALHVADRLWAAICRVTREAAADIGGRVEGVAVASMGEEGFPLDGRLQPLYPGIAWYDARTAPQAERWRELSDLDRVYAICGLLPQHTYTVHKLAWLRENEPAVWRNVRHWASVSDFVALRLSSSLSMDLSQASRTSLLDLRERRWSPDLLGLGDVPEGLLPEPVQSGTPVGDVTPQAARETGLESGIPVGAGGHDHICGALAAGVVEPGAMLHSGGTAEGIIAPLARPAPSPAARAAGLSFGCHVVPGRYYVEAGLRSGAAVRWIREVLSAPDEGRDGYARLIAAAQSSPAGARGALFLPHLYGEGPPLSGPHARGAFLGLQAHHTQGDLVRAVIEGISYGSRKVSDALAGHTGLAPTSVTAIGGLTRIRLWCELKAALLKLPVRLTSTAEAVALGAAALAGLAAGVYPDSAAAAAALARTTEVVEPDLASAAEYERRYQAWLAADAALGPAMSAVARYTD